MAKSVIRQMRYDRGVGYLWINDTTRPIPRMVMHPTLPELDGQILDDPKFNCALGRKQNLFQAFVDYLWPKPLAGAETPKNPVTGRPITEDLMAHVKIIEKEGIARNG